MRRAILMMAMLASTAAGADFAKWWPGFQAAVAKGDAAAVVRGSHFPMNWELGKIRDVKSEAGFVKDFATYFPPEMRRVVARGKPELLPNGTYILTWKSRGNEYSLYFRPDRDTFVLDALSEGPA